MTIDFHTHTFPDRIAPAAVAKLQAASRTRAFTDATVAGLKESTVRAGIDYSVVLPVATNPLKVAAMNDLSMQLNGQDGLIYFGCVHPDASDGCEELSRIARAGIRGVKIHPVYQGVDIDDVRFLRLLARAGELGLIVVTHAGDDIGFPGAAHCRPEKLRRALKQVGPVRLVAAHMGGWCRWEEAMDALSDTQTYLDTAFSLGRLVPLSEGDYSPEEQLLLSGEAFCRMVRQFGCRRILFGTDSPWADQRTAVEQIRALPLTPEEKQAILGGNAKRLLEGKQA